MSLRSASPMVRPAEWTAAAGAIALLIARGLGLHDADTITDIAIVIGFIPAAVTSTVAWLRSLRKTKA